MNQSTKQRIVGTLVLFIAALVLLSVVLDGGGSYQAPLESRIPEPPPFEPPARVIPERPVILADERLSTDEPVAESAAPDSEDGTSAESTAASDAEPAAAIAEASPISEQEDNTATTAPESAAPGDTVVTAPTAAAPVDDPVAIALAEVASRTPRLDEQGLPRGWSVRLGVFGDAGNVSSLVNRLQAAEHRAYTRPVSNGSATAVYVGPLVDRAAAENLLQKLNADFNVSGLIVPYEIETR